MAPILLTELPSIESGKMGWPWTESSIEVNELATEAIEWPKITIITPSYNQGHYIEETIRSVLLQNYPNLEYIVVDGGSTDDTITVLKKYEKFLNWISEPDEGQTDAINKGLKIASGEIVGYLNSDDLYEPGALRTIAKYFLDNPTIAMLYGDIYHIDEKSGIFELHETRDIDLEEYLKGIFYLPQPSVFFKNCVIKRIGYFDPSLHLAMDYDFWLKIVLNYKAIYVHRIFSRARIYSNAKSSAQDYKYIHERLRILNNLFGNYDLSQYWKKVYGYTYYGASLTFIRRRFFYQARRCFQKALKIDPFYMVNPRMYWALLEVFTGKKISDGYKNVLRKILPKKIVNELGFYYF